MKRGTKILTGGLTLVVASSMAAFGAPGAYAAGTVSGDVDITNTETVQVLMGADGKIDAQRVYEQLVLKGSGKVDIANPVSAKGLRNLDGFGGFDERDGQMRIKTTVDGSKKYRSVSDYTKDLPLKISISYELDGKKISPQDVVGKSGTLTVRYTVTNVTGQPQDVTFKDGDGKDETSQENVVIPMVGSLTTVLPSSFTEVKSAEANAAGDGRGGTQLSFTMTLIPPIGSDTATFGYTAKVKDARIPKATMSALPVNPLESPSFKGGAVSYQGGAETGQTLTAGATEIDSNVLKLRDGAADLVAGLVQLRDGAGQLSAGLNNDAAPGARKLAGGATKLDAGAKKLRNGAKELSGKLQPAADAAPDLSSGMAQLVAGAKAVDAGLATLNSQVVPGAGQISGGAANLIGAVNGPLSAYLATIRSEADKATALVNGATFADPADKVSALTAIGTAKATAQGVEDALKDTEAGKFMYGLLAIQKGGNDIAAGVKHTTEDLVPPDSNGDGATLKYGTSALVQGLTQLQKQVQPLIDGLPLLSGGANKLAAGAGDLKSGTSQLSSGAKQLAGGLGDAASGSGQLADGLNQASEKAPALPDGADRLSEEGMSQLIEAGNSTAKDYGLKYALIEAGAARAADAQPYGSPEGAVALTAYKFEIAGADDTGSKNVTRGIAAVLLLGAAAGAAALRRRIA